MTFIKISYLFTYNNFLEVCFYLTYKGGFYSPITLIQSEQTDKQTNKQTTIKF